jgi:predicted Zn-dependent protease with MMP-like domain
MSDNAVTERCARNLLKHRAHVFCNNARVTGLADKHAMLAQDFDQIVERAFRNIPARFRSRMNNVAVVVEDEPTVNQLKARGVSPRGILLGLYEGQPLTHRSVFEPFHLPDRITIFQGPHGHRHVGRWSTTVIGRFYNGRDHSTVCYSIQRIEALRESSPDVDALISDLKHELRVSVDSSAEKPDTKPHVLGRLSPLDLQRLADLIAERVYARI